MSLDKKMKDMEALQKKLASMQKTLSKDIINELKKLMRDNPKIEAVRWTQYTPHFNDGDVCEFGVHGPLILFDETIHPRADKEDYYNQNYVDAGPYGDYDDKFFKEKSDIINFEDIKVLEKATDDVVELFQKLESTDMATAFGDGVQVTVTQSGIEVEDCDHD